MGAELYNEGYKNITNIDVSEVLISQMNNIYSEKDEMECKILFTKFSNLYDFILFFKLSVTIMDARNMEFIPEDCFNSIIDKGLFLL